MTANLRSISSASQAGSPQGSPERVDPNSNLDNRIQAFVIVGRIFQGMAIALGIYFAVSILTVSPLYLFAEVIPMFLFTIGQELVGYRMSGSSRLHGRTVAPPFVPGQPIGFPNDNNSCPTNTAAQMLLNSRAMNAFLDQHPDMPLTVVRQHCTVARTNQQHLANVETQDILPDGIDRDAPEAADSPSVMRLLLTPIQNQITLLTLVLNRFVPDPGLPDEVTIQNTFRAAVERRAPNPRNELFIDIARAPLSRHVTLPIPLSFHLGGRNFEADAFICHVNGDHYSAFVRKTANATHTWWHVDDWRVIQLRAAPIEHLRRAAVVHFTEHLPA
ncbi:MAG: hypothetical protein ACHQT8_07710 [Chlamydiales bacterium]